MQKIPKLLDIVHLLLHNKRCHLACHRNLDYLETRDEFFYLQTKDQAEVDFIIRRRGQKPILVEIKCSERITDSHVRHLEQFMKSIPHSRAMVVCWEKTPRTLGSGIKVLPYQQALADLYGWGKSASEQKNCSDHPFGKNEMSNG